MLKIKQYVKAESLEQAYELNQKKTNRIVGGMLWLKMSTAQIQTAIDLSGLGLDQIEETEDAWKIGCMVSLRDLELHEGLNELSCNMIRESVRSIVGVQFRNLATVGGSIFGRFGFSDVLTCFLALDTWVELYKGGCISLAEFVRQKPDRDILVRLIVKKHEDKSVYLSHRNSKTDFPVLTCTASLIGEEARTVIGARPYKAMVVKDEKQILKNFKNMTRNQRTQAIADFASYAAETVHVDGNMRGSAEYRALLVWVLTRRAWEAVGGMKNEY